MTQLYKESKEISYYMCDRHQRVTLSMLVNLLLDVSEKHSEGLGRGETYVKEKGLSWIILRYDFDIQRLPKVNETVEIETVATEYNKLFTYRDFFVKDLEGNELIKVTATFALLNHSNRKMARITEELVEPYKAVFSKRIRRLAKPQEIDNSVYNEKQYEVRYFDIDSNHHVNNSHYITWLLDSLGSSYLSKFEITAGTITFDKEVSEHQIITSVSSGRKADELWTDHVITSDTVRHCQASFKWKTVEKEG
ncbi:MAG: acyl-ACP thioesterase [Alkalibacterium sp.]|nr:acyl-ACP thioesterase [Alkalibacterium sp.]